MYTYMVPGPILGKLQELLEYNSVDYRTLKPPDEHIIGRVETELSPEEILLYLEAVYEREVRIVPIRQEDVISENVRHKIRKNYADLGYLSETDRQIIRSPTEVYQGLKLLH